MKATTRDGREIDLNPDALNGLKLRLRGPVLVAGDAGYEESRTVWNAMIDRKPAAVARCLGVADVIACVQFAREHDLLLSIKGGGHNIAEPQAGRPPRRSSTSTRPPARPRSIKRVMVWDVAT